MTAFEELERALETPPIAAKPAERPPKAQAPERPKATFSEGRPWWVDAADTNDLCCH